MTFRPPTSGPLWLASRSPRRRRMLGEAGVPVTAWPAGVDDGRLRPGAVTPEHWVVALAYLKARWVVDDLADIAPVVGTVLGADTVCVHDGVILGQPGSADAARSMLLRLQGGGHRTLTGVCLISRLDRRRWAFVDATDVQFAPTSADEIDRYIVSGAWRGKAGGYNLQDRLDAGWDIECIGDPTTVMGLPMRRLEPWFERVRRGAEAAS